MTDERLAELAQFYRKWNEGRCNTGEIVTLLCSIPSLLAYVDFLRLLLHDMKEDSTAYRRGLQDGVRQERERCLGICKAVERSVGSNRSRNGGIIEGARRCADGVQGESVTSCSVCDGKGYVEDEIDVTTRSDPPGSRRMLPTLKSPCPACSGTSSASTPSPSSVE